MLSELQEQTKYVNTVDMAVKYQKDIILMNLHIMHWLVHKEDYKQAEEYLKKANEVYANNDKALSVTYLKADCNY